VTGLLQIRNVPDEARRTLKARAADRGESLNAYLLDVIAREVERPTVAEVLRAAASRAERSAASTVEIVAAMRAEREAEIERRIRG